MTAETKREASTVSNPQRPTGTGKWTGKEVLDAELYQSNHSLRQPTTTPIIDCDARQMAEEISLGRMIIV